MGRMFDSTNAWDIPATAEAVAGYDDGEFAWPADRWQAWDHVPCLHITVEGLHTSMAADAELGNFNTQLPDVLAGRVAAWAAGRVAAGLPAVIYCPHHLLADIESALGAHGLQFGAHTWPDPGVYLWMVDATGVPHLWPGSVATQYAVSSQTGGHFDLSETAGRFPAVDPAPVPPVPPAPPAPSQEIPEMVIIHSTDPSVDPPADYDAICDGIVAHRIHGGSSLQAWIAKLGPPITLEWMDYSSYLGAIEPDTEPVEPETDPNP